MGKDILWPRRRQLHHPHHSQRRVTGTTKWPSVTSYHHGNQYVHHYKNHLHCTTGKSARQLSRTPDALKAQPVQTKPRTQLSKSLHSSKLIERYFPSNMNAASRLNLCPYQSENCNSVITFMFQLKHTVTKFYVI